MALADEIRKARRVFIIGNGGSYANAVHMANDLISVGIPAFTLDPATLTAIANDFGYENVFSRWLSVVGGESGDLVVALSGSGTSKNILNAIVTADELGMEHLLVSDFLRTMNMQRSEEHQLELAHEAMLCLKNS